MKSGRVVAKGSEVLCGIRTKAGATATPKVTKAQAIEAAEKYMARSPGFTTKTITCVRTSRSTFSCKVLAKVRQTGETCNGGLIVIFHKGKVKALVDKRTSREPGSC